MDRYKKIGQFIMDQNLMRVSDPCYDKTVWCCGTIPGCLKGLWDAAVIYAEFDGWGTRVAMLIAKHSSLPTFDICDDLNMDDQYFYFSGAWTKCEFEVGVDSGQAGLFDDSKYRDSAMFEGSPEPQYRFDDDRWFNQCFDLTTSDAQAGTMPFGVVSRSGIGDGGYIALKHENKDGMVDAVIIAFG